MRWIAASLRVCLRWCVADLHLALFSVIDIAFGTVTSNLAAIAAIDSEWASLKECYETYLSDSNFDENGIHKTALSALTKPILYKLDSLEFLD